MRVGCVLPFMGVTNAAIPRRWVVCLLLAMGGTACSTVCRTDAERAWLASAENALGAFHADTGRYPTTAEGLGALLRDPGLPGWGGPYLGSGWPVESYVYESDGWSEPVVRRKEAQVRRGWVSRGAVPLSGKVASR